MLKHKYSATLGQVLDELADRYFAAGYDAYTAKVLALRDIVKVLRDADVAAQSMLEKFLRGDR